MGPLKYGENFHELYTNRSENRKHQNDKRSKDKRNKKDEKRNENIQSDQIYPTYSVAQIELEPNASKFSIYSAIRSAVLEADTKYALFQNKVVKKISQNCCFICVTTCKTNNIVECTCHSNDKKNRDEMNSDADSETEEVTEKETTAKVPQIVGAGLRSLFELISDARNIQPNLCTKALKALLDVIQGQQPESFKYEPDDLINPLYDLLLDLATLHEPITAEKSGTGGYWSSISCSALIGLCVARGDTGKILKAIAALLMSPKMLSSQIVQLPLVLSSLQRTVISAILNKPTKPDFHTHGVPKNSLISEFSLRTALTSYTNYNTQPAMASDGKYLYLLVDNALLKIGTGFNGTYKGHVYNVNNDFGQDISGWLGICGGKLYCKWLSKRSNESVLIINTDTFAITGSTAISSLSTRESQNFVLFSDEDSINAICTNKDDSLIVKQLYTNGSPVFELPLKLARKKFRTLGYAAFEDEVLNQNQIQKIQSSYNMFEPKLPNDLEIQSIKCGKEFGLVRAPNGKIYYYGKSASLGLKSVGRTPTMKMTELIISKVSNIVQIAIGHDGVHALLVNDDGTVYFAGTARRGEDGDSSKNRRQPKASKPKKLSKVDGHVVVQAACNNGTSAFVTKTGKLIMFGKDTAHCDSLGFVTDLLDQHITKVALGKAHCVALNNKGQLFTFGLNNKGQCGRSFTKEKEANSAENESNASGQKAKLDFTNLCDFDDHVLVQGQCRVCSVCKECTGYNISCVSSLNVSMEERISGSLCPCGHGDAGCSKCGACSSCISIQEVEINGTKDPKQITLLNRQRSKSLILRKKDKKMGEENNPPSDMERDTPRVAPLSPQKVSLPTKSAVVQIACGLHHTVVMTLVGEVFTFGSNQYGQLGTGDLQPIMGPVQVKIQGLISQVAAGSNHTVLLTFKGMVYTFGNYQKGQLGRLPNDFHKNAMNDDSSKEDAASKDNNSSNILAQRQKFLWNCTPGAVFGLGPSFGKKATWVGAGGDQTFIKIDESLITPQMLPKVNIVADKKTILLIPTIPLSFHVLTINRRDGSCTAHYRNQLNFVKIIQSNVCSMPEINQNINPNMMMQNQDQMSRSVHEARNQIFEQENQNRIPDRRRRRRQDNKSPSDKVCPQIAFALEPHFNVLWVFDGGAKKILCYDVVASEIQENTDSNFHAILSPELALSQKGDSNISQSQASLNLLACLDILTSTQDAIPTCFEQTTPEQTNLAKESQSSEYQTVYRFENFGGGWGYSGHSVEAIRFMTDTDVMICGFGMFGGRGEYSCKLKLYDLGPDGGSYEKDGILISETKDIPYECPARSKYHIMLPKPVTAIASRWYLVWTRIAGPSSDCGSSGQSTVTTEDQIVFNFKSSKKANNGTDVNSGQIPSIIYRLITQETKQPPLPIDIDPVHKISKSFANTVTKECFDSIVLLLNWSWETFKANLKEQRDKSKQLEIKSTLDHLVYVNKSSLRLLRKYTNEIYPQKLNKSSSKKSTEINTQTYNVSKNLPSAPRLFIGPNDLPTPTRKTNMENIQLAECIGNVRALLIQILCDDIFKDVNTEDGYDMTLQILDECHTSFVACFDAFYPTSSLKWNCLCDLLSQMDKGIMHSRLLSAILAGLCNPTVKLRSTFSLLTPGNERQSIISPSDNSGLPMLSSTENHQYPILVEQMIYRTQQEKIDFLSNSWTFKDVLIRFLDIISNPIKVKIENIYNRCTNFNESKYGKDFNQGLINNCCQLLARVLAEIVYQTTSGDFDATFMPPRSLHSTGSRFARCDVSRTWNTGNFGPDAIAFSVDRPGIAIAGAMIYSGSGCYEYQLELLFDNTVDPQSHHKWETLESISGSYDQDAVQNDMAEIKFDRPVHIKENTRYSLRLCSQGARTCSGDGGLPTIRGPCGTTFTFHTCDLSFNGTTPTRGQIPCILYYSTPIRNEGHAATYISEITARDTALQIATDITKKCTELLILARNALAASISPSDKSPNSSNHTQTIDSEHNITPIEEHLDITWANNSRNSVTQDGNISTARDITKRIESFSKGIIETLKFDKRSTNPFDFEIEIGATEIHPKDLIEESDVNDKNYKNGRIAKFNGNDRMDNNHESYLKEMVKSDSEESTQLTIVQLLELFNMNSSNMFHTLLPLVYAHVGALACNDPKSSVQILSLIKEILPHVAALNQLYASKEHTFPPKDDNQDKRDANIDANKKKVEDLDRNIYDMCTTSNHYCVVESEHPYKSASLNTFRVEFPPCVQWMTVEFDSQCGTAQMEDYLLLSIPDRTSVHNTNTIHDDYSDLLDNNICTSRRYCKNASVVSSCFDKLLDEKNDSNDKYFDSEWIIIKKFNTPSNWSQNVLVLPGNRIEFSLETASFYAQDQQANKFGFKSLVIGYDNPTSTSLSNSCLIRLEYELSYLGGMCSANLMKKDLNLPDDKSIEDLSSVEETLAVHSNLLSKGLALSDSILTVNQALESYLPVGSQSNERQFLKDFISGAPGSSGARLAAWLQPEPRLDPNKCELNPISEPIRYGWPTQLTVTIRDQYGDTVVVPDLKVEIKAIPSGAIVNGTKKLRRVSCTESNSLGGVAPPPRISYEPTFKEKMCFKAISFMKAYSQYSFEELRFCSPVQTRITETLSAQDMEDGTFGIAWTPNSVGSYCLTVNIDGILLEDIYRVEVKEGGIPPPPQKATIKKPQPPNKLRQFVAKNSAGLRIRSHPTLQSEQIGIVKMNGVISFIDEIDNDDGIWVRLSTESIRQHCTAGLYPTEAWCLQYNQHINKKLLHPINEHTTTKTATTKIKQKSVAENTDSTQSIELQPKVKSGSPKKGYDFSSARFTPPLSSDSAQSSSTNPFVFTSSNSSKGYEDKPSSAEKSSTEYNLERSNDSFNQMFDIQSAEDVVCRQSQDVSNFAHNSNQSNIGSAIAGVVGGGASKLQALQKWFKGDSFESKEGVKKKSDFTEITSVSVRDLVKAIGAQETKSNGNGGTPPQISRSSSPVFIPPLKQIEGISVYSSSSKSVEVSDTSVLASSLTRDLSQSPSQGSIKEDMSSSPKLTDSHTSQSDGNPTAIRLSGFSLGPGCSNLATPKHSARKLRNKRAMGSGCSSNQSKDLKSTEQSLPDLNIKIDQTASSNTTIANALDSKSSSASTDNLSPPVWPPAPVQFITTKMAHIIEEKPNRVGPPKRAIPPSLAESLRAVFAAFLWHEGLVHDAMACASFLKFYPSLPKEGALVVTRRDANEGKIHLSREQKAQQRHSVEVANAGNYLNIRPSTLETLTKSGNSSINNRRYRKNTTENDTSDKPKLQPLPEVVAVLPPALRCLVYLWEQLCSNCIQIVQSNALDQQKPSSPRQVSNSKDKSDTLEKENKKLRKKKKDDGSWCELCEIFLPIPVTYHMRIVHPGCGKSAKGKGYNSVGIFCEGWAGNCGEGGKGASSWFLMCDACREKYISTSKNVNNINHSASGISPGDINLFGIKATSLIANSEIYTTMRDNAIFLLELSSSTSSLLTNQKRSPQQMPVVTEDQLNMFTDMNRPSTSRGDSVPNSNRNSRIGLKMNGKFNGFSSTPHRKSSCFPPCISPELMWQAPDAFSCLESLGASINDDLPYEIFGLNSTENCFDRPLSEMSFDSCDPNNSDLMAQSATHTANTLSRFHRSFSMGQGWTGQSNFGTKNYPQPYEDQQQMKVILRRRNNSTSDSDCSLLLCYPSENLRKLVPENILSASCIVHPAAKVQQPSNTEDKTNDDQVPTEADGDAQASGSLEAAQKDFIFSDCNSKLSQKEFANNELHNQKETSNSIEIELNANCLLSRPAMAFITQQHDLEKLRYTMKRSLRIATCRIYSLQALNWLVRSVTQPVCLHDLMWWFVASLSSSNPDDVSKTEEIEPALEHPVSLTQMSGRISQVLSQSLHTFLQSVADLTLLLPAGSSLQRIAIQCFGIKFRQADHQFLHSSHVFGNISKILSKSDEQNEAMLVSSSLAMVDSNSHMLEHNFANPIGNLGAKLCNYIELTGMFEITVSSRQALADSLIDNSTETFWESDEEDRNKCKIIEISMNKLNYVCKFVFVHIDNSRDVQNKVLNVVFFAGQSLGDTNLIKTVDIDSKACTWISAKVSDESYTHFRLEFRGPENTLRVRQIKLLGLPNNLEEPHIFPKANPKITNSLQIQQRSCESETLRVFRLITGQVFGKLISTADNLLSDNINLVTHPSVMESSANSLLADSLDLREHMVGILFSRSKLSHLQKQVIVHIVHAIKKEAQRAKEEWEISNATASAKDVHFVNDQKSDSSSDRFRAPDTYCFEMLSMVLALSGSAVGRSYLSHQHGLLKDLLSLLHTGSDRVQRQVTALLRRILPEISPDSLGDLLAVQKMPPTDFNIVNQNAGDFDMNRLGILDIFLAVIAKSLQLQIKIKTTTKANLEKTPAVVKLCNCIDVSVHLLKTEKKSGTSEENQPGCSEPRNQFEFDTGPMNRNYNDFEIVRKKPKDTTTKNLNQRWFMKGVISTKQAESIISLIRDMASGKLSEKWSLVTKAAIAESVLNLTRLDEVFRTPENCIKTATLWLALASLCVLDKDHVEKLSSGQWSKVSDTRPLCTNHDDGETPAVIQCQFCGSLCGDCDRFLHLNRKTRNHRRTVCKEEEEAIRVELHESCGRTKLFWLLALGDSRTLKGMVEFRDGSNTIISGPQETVGRCRFCGVTGNSGLLEIGNVCAESQCQEYAVNACSKIKSCGHTCGGVANEEKCLPCLQPVCHERENENAERLKEPKLTQDGVDMCMICFVETLSCAPSVQLECGHVFHYHCCKLVLEKRWTGPRITFRFSSCGMCNADIQHSLLKEFLKPINALKIDVKRKALMRLKYEGVVKPQDHKDLAAYAMDRYAYYVCFKCKKAYFGGEARCDAEAGENFDPKELVCGGCSDVARAQMCTKHGTDFLEYKCRYCCSVAVFFCFGTTHFCDTCHDDFQRLTNIAKNKLPQCPAGPKAKQLLGDDCPLHIVHPPTGEEFALGCGICRNAQTF